MNTVGNFLPTERITLRLPCGEIMIEFVGSLINDRYGIHNEERRYLVSNELVNDGARAKSPAYVGARTDQNAEFSNLLCTNEYWS